MTQARFGLCALVVGAVVGGIVGGLLWTSPAVAQGKGAPSAPAAPAPAKTFVVERSLSTWTEVVVAIPRATVPRAALVAFATWLSSPGATTDGTLALVRSRGGHLRARSNADGLIVHVGGAAEDGRLLLEAALSVLDDVTIPPVALNAALRSLRRGQLTTPMDVMRGNAWQAFFARPAPDTPASAPAFHEMTAREVAAAAAQLARKDVVVVVEGPLSIFGADKLAAAHAIDQARQQKVSRVASVVRASAFVGQPLPSPPRLTNASSTVSSSEDASVPVLLAHPLASDVARDPLAAPFLAAQLRGALFGSNAAATPRAPGDAWIETSGNTALLFIRPMAGQPIDDVKQRLEVWRKTSRFRRGDFDAAAAVADQEAQANFAAGQTAQRLATRAIAHAPSTRLSIDADALSPARVREWLEEFPLLIFPEQIRVVRSVSAPRTL